MFYLYLPRHHVHLNTGNIKLLQTSFAVHLCSHNDVFVLVCLSSSFSLDDDTVHTDETMYKQSSVRREMKEEEQKTPDICQCFLLRSRLVLARMTREKSFPDSVYFKSNCEGEASVLKFLMIEQLPLCITDGPMNKSTHVLC